MSRANTSILVKPNKQPNYVNRPPAVYDRETLYAKKRLDESKCVLLNKRIPGQ